MIGFAWMAVGALFIVVGGLAILSAYVGSKPKKGKGNQNEL